MGRTNLLDNVEAVIRREDGARLNCSSIEKIEKLEMNDEF